MTCPVATHILTVVVTNVVNGGNTRLRISIVPFNAGFNLSISMSALSLNCCFTTPHLSSKSTALADMYSNSAFVILPSSYSLRNTGNNLEPSLPNSLEDIAAAFC